MPTSLDRRVVFMIVLACGCVEQSSMTTEDLQQCAGGVTTAGVDVSEYQGNIDWNAVKASGNDFAFIRVGDGFYFDPKFDQNWQGAAAAGVARGAYQFFRPGEDGTAQADWFLQHVSGGEIAPTLDVELTDGQSSATIVAGIGAWVARIQQVTGRTPIVYTAPGFWAGIGGAESFGTTLWVAHWFTNCPTLPGSWDHWAFWQYADNGYVPGIPGAVDLDVFDGSPAELGGGPAVAARIAPIGAALNGDGRLEVFVPGVDTQLWHDWQVTPGGGWWGGFWGMTGSMTGAPIAVPNADGRLEVFVRGGDAQLWHQWQVTAGGSWSGFWPMTGNITDSPAVATNADGRLEVFVHGGDGELWHQFQTTPGGAWSGFAPLTGNITGTPAVARNADGRLEVFVRGLDGQLWHQWQVTPGGAWSGFWPMTGSISDSPAVEINADGRLEVFVRGSDGQLWHQWQLTPGGGWSHFEPLAGCITGTPAVARNADGRLEVFVRGCDTQLWHQFQTVFGWSGFTGLTGSLSDSPMVTHNSDGRLEVFVRGGDGALWHQWQTTANGSWSGFDSLGIAMQ